LIILDRQGRCTHWNPAAEALFGWSEEDMVGSALTRLVDVASRLPLARVLGDAAAGTAVRWSDAIWVSASGEPLAVDVTVGPIIDERDRRIGLVALARDVREGREAATALARAHEALGLHAAELSAANLRLATFAGTLAHDLMQPLAAVDGFLSLLDREAMELADGHRDWLTTAIRGKDRLRVAIESLYRNATASELDLAEVDLAGVVAEIAEELGPELGDAEVVVGDLPVVEGDRGFVVQVFANLLQNANRYRHHERPLVISVESWTEGTSLVVSVSDSGKGISTDELERVFSPGERGRSATGTEGTGTGLATVRTLMHRMGGEVWAEPVPSGGVRMCLRFSAAVAPALDVPA
jgi:PAS domain S-box-containing protein